MKKIRAEVFWAKLQFLEGDETCLCELRSVIGELVVELIGVPHAHYGSSMLPLFRRCVLGINAIGLTIETLERDSVLEVLSRLGEIVGLSRERLYLEEWRGDW